MDLNKKKDASRLKKDSSQVTKHRKPRISLAKSSTGKKSNKTESLLSTTSKISNNSLQIQNRLKSISQNTVIF